ncbi:hypothetical protein BpHYR1_001013 [Brachionus plicatilis]|uniref:Uncharacterized protein n=1 Tax=Brachionus plicatilis TaxID=10195 RepID=A0A3M7PB85_BRAPC|nr:hypothetical protein BpHYR1_001013 [Brachionus plicatilis]
MIKFSTKLFVKILKNLNDETFKLFFKLKDKILRFVPYVFGFILFEILSIDALNYLFSGWEEMVNSSDLSLQL